MDEQKENDAKRKKSRFGTRRNIVTYLFFILAQSKQRHLPLHTQAFPESGNMGGTTTHQTDIGILQNSYNLTKN
ncbi:MAG: hypothetical protein IM584_03720 [Chitinophagaceae bacterium]|nr:hypothetical protein [Chitinophagaceae bacterium]MCA6452801.1 hypothetical protein [Chitinophagaceae bacterium]MCA6455223.1 hypothetical protein [Chitinophagaceae bacterium]MCA6458395.1 hypothetical protein [Chitinophagaceae bacterium]MCA6465418.1 hypothetical protein [Chitinophagaceae bacterium]